MQESSVASAFREECSYLIEGALTEYHAVEHTIDDIAQGSSGDERYAEQRTEFYFLLAEMVDDEIIIAEGGNKNRIYKLKA